MNLVLVLENYRTYMKFDPVTKRISGRCKKDENNLPSCYSKTVRSNKKGWAVLSRNWTQETSMYGACEILRENCVNMHSYCAMD